jgi:hypothetical protein
MRIVDLHCCIGCVIQLLDALHSGDMHAPAAARPAEKGTLP